MCRTWKGGNSTFSNIWMSSGKQRKWKHKYKGHLLVDFKVTCDSIDLENRKSPRGNTPECMKLAEDCNKGFSSLFFNIVIQVVIVHPSKAEIDKGQIGNKNHNRRRYFWSYACNWQSVQLECTNTLNMSSFTWNSCKKPYSTPFFRPIHTI